MSDDLLSQPTEPTEPTGSTGPTGPTELDAGSACSCAIWW
jgi:hypothetical protein